MLPRLLGQYSDNSSNYEVTVKVGNSGNNMNSNRVNGETVEQCHGVTV